MRGAVGEFQRMLKQLSSDFQLLSCGRGWELTWRGDDHDKTEAEVATLMSNNGMAFLSTFYGTIEVDSSGAITRFDFDQHDYLHVYGDDPLELLREFIRAIGSEQLMHADYVEIKERPRGAFTEIDVVTGSETWYNYECNGERGQRLGAGEMKLDEVIRTVVGRFTYNHAQGILTHR